jgi:hypothetical protein
MFLQAPALRGLFLADIEPTIAWYVAIFIPPVLARSQQNYCE